MNNEQPKAVGAATKVVVSEPQWIKTTERAKRLLITLHIP